MTNDELTETLRRELRPILDRLEPLVAGIPLIHRNIEALRREAREIRAAVNDLAALQMTSGEAAALHADVDKTMTKQDELETRLTVVERLVRELTERR